MANSVTFRFSGGEQFVLDLRQWRDRLRAEVHQAALDQGNAIASVVGSQYPFGKTGKLRAGVRVKDESPYGDAIQVRVRTLAPHSHLYEKGTKVRRTSRGWNRGAAHPHPIFIPQAIAHRTLFKHACRRILGSPEPAIGSGSPTLTGSL